MSLDITARAMGLAALAVVSRLFYVLHEKDLMTAPEIEQVIKDAERCLAHHTNEAAGATHGAVRN